MLPKKNRLRTGFKSLLATGTKKKTAYFLIIYKKSNNNFSRFGFIVTKKVGNAVLRNKLKRMFKHIIRENLAFIPSNLEVVLMPSPFVKDWKSVDKKEVSNLLIDILKGL